MDHARLQALTLDSVAYGLALGQMVLVGDIATTFLCQGQRRRSG
jgi:hypothetical protein